MAGYDIATIGALGDATPCCSACASTGGSCGSAPTMGTVFGQQTIEETRHLMNTVEFRIALVEADLPKLTATPANVQLAKDWAAFKDRWVAARDAVLSSMRKRKIAQVFVPESLIIAQGDFDSVLKAIGQGTGAPTSLGILMSRTEAATGDKLDETNHPIPAGFDADLEPYKAADAAVKAAEAAAAASQQAAGDFASSNIGLMLIGAAVLVVGGVIVAKVYL